MTKEKQWIQLKVTNNQSHFADNCGRSYDNYCALELLLNTGFTLDSIAPVPLGKDELPGSSTNSWSVCIEG